MVNAWLSVESRAELHITTEVASASCWPETVTVCPLEFVVVSSTVLPVLDAPEVIPAPKAEDVAEARDVLDTTEALDRDASAEETDASDETEETEDAAWLAAEDRLEDT